MRVPTEAEDLAGLDPTDYSHPDTLAWRVLCRMLGVRGLDPMMVIDGGTQYLFDPPSKVRFRLSPTGSRAYETGCWRPDDYFWVKGTYYVQYTVAEDFSWVEFAGWYRPREDAQVTYATQNPPLERMDLLLIPMRRRLAQTR